MYIEHFNLKEYPFTLTPNTEFFFEAQPYKEALDTILISLKNEEGFIKITGPVGSGKTLLCRRLLNKIPDNFVVAYIPNPALPANELYKMIIHELEGHVEATESAFDIQKKLNSLLIKVAEQEKIIVLIIDEAQTMSDLTLEALRLLTNLETEKRKLLQIVLFGQPELDEKLNTHQFRQLKQRIVFSYKLRALNKNEFFSYVYHRITSASVNYQHIFTKKALQKIYKASAGIPRLINILCHKSMIAAYGKGASFVTEKNVKQAVRDTFKDEQTKEALKPTFKMLAEIMTLLFLSAVFITQLWILGMKAL